MRGDSTKAMTGAASLTEIVHQDRDTVISPLISIHETHFNEDHR